MYKRKAIDFRDFAFFGLAWLSFLFSFSLSFKLAPTDITDKYTAQLKHLKSGALLKDTLG